MFSILIPTFNNIEYLKLCLRSIKKNSYFNHQIICHVNIGEDGTIEHLKKENIEHTYTKYNSGVCEGINKASKLSKFKYLLYGHDDFYYCPNWDLELVNQVNDIKSNNFYLSGTMINNGQINFNCGSDINNFDEKKLLENYLDHNIHDFQGSTWAPTLIHKDIWEKVSGFSEEFFPGAGSDPDFCMKLWKQGIRIFKGINNCKVYHFGSISLRKKKKKLTNYGSLSGKIFLLKWGISIKFFRKFYLKSNSNYDGPLKNPIKNLKYFSSLLVCKINYIYLKWFYKKIDNNFKT